MSIKPVTFDHAIGQNTQRIASRTSALEAEPTHASEIATPLDTAKMLTQAGTVVPLNQRGAPTSDGIFTVGDAAVKTATTKKSAIASSWGFVSISIGILGLLGSFLGATSVAQAHSNGHGHGHHKDHPSYHHQDHDGSAHEHAGSGQCYKGFEYNIDATGIRGGHHITFGLSGLKELDSPDVHVDSVVLTLVLEGKRKDLEKAGVAINGINSCGQHGKRLVDLIDDYERLFGKHKDRTKDKFVVSLDLTWLLINSQQHFRGYFEGLLMAKSSLTLSVLGPMKVEVADLKLDGKIYEPCSGGPGPRPAPTASPTPTYTPGPAPDTIIDSVIPAISPTKSTTMSISFSSNRPPASFMCSLDGGPEELCSSPRIYSGVGNGTHTFKVVAVAPSGHRDPDGATYTWVVDTIPPDVIISSIVPADSVTNSSSMTLEFSSSETSQYQCAIDGGEYTQCTSPLKVTGFGEAEHEIDIIGTDAAGNTSLAPARHRWRVDLTPPQALITQVEPAGAVTSSAKAVFYFGANESSRFECSLDGEVFTSCVSPLELNALADGQHSFSVRAIDVAANVSLPASYNWAIDRTPPEIALGNIVPAAGPTNSRNISAEFTANEAASFRCSFDGAESVACNSPFTATVEAEGAHVMVIEAIDLAGNHAEPVSLEWTMDFTSPQISFGVISPSASSYVNSQSLTVFVNATEPVHYRARLDDVFLGQNISPIVLEGLGEGFHSIVLDAVDYSGNLANTIIHNFTVDLTAPAITLSSAIAEPVTNSTTNSLSFSMSEQGTFECSFNGSLFALCSNPYHVSGLVEGTHVFQVRAIDLAGNASNIASHTWALDTSAAVTTITSFEPSESVIAVTKVSIAFASSEAETRFECALDGGTYAPCSSPASFSGLSDGFHSIQVRSIDAAGNTESVPATRSFTVDTRAPLVTLRALVSARTSSDSASFEFVADEPQTAFECAMDANPYRACVSPITYEGLSEGEHRFSVVGRDSVGNYGVPVSFSWIIDRTAPQTSLVAEQAESSGASIAFTLTSSELGSTFACSLDGQAFQTCTSPVSYSDLSGGAHRFTARAIDAVGNEDLVGATHEFTVAGQLTTTITNVSPSAEITNQTSIDFAFESSDALATFQCSLDGAAATSCVSPMSYSGLANGTHTFLVQAVKGTVIDTVGASHSWAIDTVSPQVLTITVTVTKTTATVNWTTNKPMTTGLYWGLGTDTSNLIPEDSVYKTSHTVKISGLKSNTAYSYKIIGHDQVGNFLLGSRRVFRTLQ